MSVYATIDTIPADERPYGLTAEGEPEGFTVEVTPDYAALPPSFAGKAFEVSEDFDSATCESPGCAQGIGGHLDDRDDEAPFYRWDVLLLWAPSVAGAPVALCEECGLERLERSGGARDLLDPTTAVATVEGGVLGATS